MSDKYRLGYPNQDRSGLTDEDVVSKSGGFGFHVSADMLKMNALINAILSWARGNGKYESSEYTWFTEKGFECEVLSTKGGGWRKGRFRIRLEFVPDNPEEFMEVGTKSELDDLRSDLQL